MMAVYELAQIDKSGKFVLFFECFEQELLALCAVYHTEVAIVPHKRYGHRSIDHSLCLGHHKLHGSLAYGVVVGAHAVEITTPLVTSLGVACCGLGFELFDLLVCEVKHIA